MERSSKKPGRGDQSLPQQSRATLFSRFPGPIGVIISSINLDRAEISFGPVLGPGLMIGHQSVNSKLFRKNATSNGTSRTSPKQAPFQEPSPRSSVKPQPFGVLAVFQGFSRSWDKPVFHPNQPESPGNHPGRQDPLEKKSLCNFDPRRMTGELGTPGTVSLESMAGTRESFRGISCC